MRPEAMLDFLPAGDVHARRQIAVLVQGRQHFVLISR